MKPRTKAPKDEQLTEPLQGELAAYAKVGLFQRSVNNNTAYRYRGVLLSYQKALSGAEPNLENSRIYLGHIREQGYSPSTLRIHRAVLQGFHAYRGENLVFAVRVPSHQPAYIDPEVVAEMLNLAKDKPRDYLVLRLLTDAGMRRDEAVNLKVGGVGQKAMRFRGKGGKDRTVPLTEELRAALVPFCTSKHPDELVLGFGEGVIYRIVKKYAAMAGHPEMKPHDLRNSFATRLLEHGVNIRAVQELLVHSNVATTQQYTAVLGSHLEDAIKALHQPLQNTPSANDISRIMELLTQVLESSSKPSEPPYDPTAGINPVTYG